MTTGPCPKVYASFLIPARVMEYDPDSALLCLPAPGTISRSRWPTRERPAWPRLKERAVWVPGIGAGGIAALFEGFGGRRVRCSSCGNNRYVEWCPYCDDETPSLDGKPRKRRMNFADITSVDMSARVARLDTGENIPVTNMFDARGEETDDPNIARRVVAGPCADGNWYAFVTDEPEGNP